MSKLVDKRKCVCRNCSEVFCTEKVRRTHGSCSHVYMLDYCSLECYAKDYAKDIDKS